MKKLARKWRNSGDDKFSLPIHDDEDSRPMGPQEQEEFVRSLEATQAENNRFWRRVFAILLFCYMQFLLYSIFKQVTSPWEMRPYAYFMEDIYSWMIISADWMAVLVCSFSMKGLIDESVHHRRWIWYSWFTAIVPAMFWLYYMLRLPKFRWDVIFLPFGPLGGATICLYVDHLLSESSEEIRKLRGYMYSYKAG
ncbi:hypothetical protein HN51_036407 [Arachis hypogaea]|uniref:Uncharacterized protein n=2 Tax=Arachis hypogaea TaxID=3818 RepID=A0A445A061_ARAHY|nr:uncharacterized protein LOC107630632 isoform X1 [Arachis ipaensis]XP_025636819.1 uncharacterized protein LOC112732341 isoform X1 [Arachis hypogaea]RYR19816.1 hypothetical protein Ahy_B03g064721 isoform C [Arachis hypogaea]